LTFNVIAIRLSHVLSVRTTRRFREDDPMHFFRRRLSFLRRPWLFLIPIVALLMASWFVLPGNSRVTFGADGTPSPTPICPRINDPQAIAATPDVFGTPTMEFICTETGLATPLTVDGLNLTVNAAQDQAGPVDLTIAVTNARGEPVVDAEVVVLSQHLGMSHGVSVDEAFHTGEGVYQVNDVSMGMGGDWQVEIQVERADQPVVAAVFTIALQGPS
jgi:hypothetical protein